MRPEVQAFLDPDTETYSYVVYERPGGYAAVTDSVLDYDPKSGRTRTDGAQRLVDFVQDNNFIVDWALETHAPRITSRPPLRALPENSREPFMTAGAL